jgi:hypothetical protein
MVYAVFKIARPLHTGADLRSVTALFLCCCEANITCSALRLHCSRNAPYFIFSVAMLLVGFSLVVCCLVSLLGQAPIALVIIEGSTSEITSILRQSVASYSTSSLALISSSNTAAEPANIPAQVKYDRPHKPRNWPDIRTAGTRTRAPAGSCMYSSEWVVTCECHSGRYL